VTEFVSKLADTVRWSSVGAAVLGLILKLTQTVRNSLVLTMPELLRTLTSNIGKKLTAFVAGVDHPEIIDSWIAGEPSPTDAEKRLRFTYQIVMTIAIKDSPAVAQAWLVGVNPELSDRVPIRLLRESTLDQVAGPIVAAARAFAAGG
jgi:hypothetical protein